MLSDKRVLIVCEESQTVAKAFRCLGIPAISCDILEASGGHPEWHIQGDVTELLKQEWDLVIAFPPCTDLAVSGARHFKAKQADGRQQASIEFFMQFTDVNAPHWCVENPVGIMSTHYRKPDQIIQPWQFGDPYQKTTCLWTKGLPQLQHTSIVEPGAFSPYGDGNKMATWISNAPPKERKRIRSKTFQGIADAMAHQWSKVLLNES